MVSTFIYIISCTWYGAIKRYINTIFGNKLNDNEETTLMIL